MATSFKQLLAEDRFIRLFSMGRIIHPVMIDMFGLAGGYDGFWLDQEHGGLTYDQINLASVCARANNFDCFVRMATTSYALVTQNFEAGAGGVMAARVESAADAEEFVQWAKFGPRGMRGMNTSGWDAGYTHVAPKDFAEAANRDHFVAIQIETIGALKEVDQIAAIDGVDLLFVGPADLSQALGHLGQLSHEEVWDAIGAVWSACKTHGKHWGTISVNPEFASRAVENGCKLMIFGGDVLCQKLGIEAVKKSYASQFAD